MKRNILALAACILLACRQAAADPTAAQVKAWQAEAGAAVADMQAPVLRSADSIRHTEEGILLVMGRTYGAPGFKPATAAQSLASVTSAMRICRTGRAMPADLDQMRPGDDEEAPVVAGIVIEIRRNASGPGYYVAFHVRRTQGRALAQRDQ